MNEIQNKAAELCDLLMKEAKSGDLSEVEQTIVLLIEYAGYELARHSGGKLSTSVFLAAQDLTKAFSRQRSEANALPKYANSASSDTSAGYLGLI